MTRAPGRRRVMIASKTLSQIGTVAITTAATPVGMNCSESTTPPLPPSSSSVPTTAAVRHCAALGRSQEPPPPSRAWA